MGFYVMSSGIINKLIYFSYGTKDVLERQCQNLNRKISLYMDKKLISLPDIEAVVVLNIPCWGAGVRPWELGSGLKDFPCSPSLNIAQMQVGLSEPHRVGQAREVRIVLSDSVPMQIDGEPWEQHPADICLSHHKQVDILQMTS